MPLHVEQLTTQTAGVAGIHTPVGDVRDLDLPDSSVDAVLLLGPLYHLIDRAERVRALRECARFLWAGGPVFAAPISRWAARIDGMPRARIYLKHPAFTAFCHRPGERRDEMAEAGLEVADMVTDIHTRRPGCADYGPSGLSDVL
jgi:SAM-dependent methyltransferase